MTVNPSFPSLTPPWLLTVQGELGITLSLAGRPSSCSWLSFNLSPGLDICSAYPEYLGYVGTLFISFSFVTSLPLTVFLFLFLMVQKNAYIWYYFLCRVVSVSLLAKELWTWLAWVWGVQWCIQLPSRSSPTVNYPLCVCPLCLGSSSPQLRSNTFLPLALFHCDVLNTGFLPPGSLIPLANPCLHPNPLYPRSTALDLTSCHLWWSLNSKWSS